MKYDNMDDCFASMENKVRYGLENSDLTKISQTLNSIQGPTLVCGVGGSSVVALFLAKALRERKHLLATFAYPRDLLYMDLSGYESIIAVSYSGNNIGVSALDDLPLKRYLFTGHPREGYENIVYQMAEEISYVSINATIVPMAIILNCLGYDKETILQLLKMETSISSDNTRFEVLYGYETLTAAMQLESSLSESGLASCILHEKYNYCHGRINLTRHNDGDLIFFAMDNELDEMLKEQLPKYYKKIITVPRNDPDDLLNDFCDTILALKFLRNIAIDRHYDISDMKELPDNDVLYLFKGKMK